MKFQIAEGYLGMCSKCQKDATHAEWIDFGPPSEIDLRIEKLTGIPYGTGCWHHVCDKCCDANAKHEKS